MIKKVSYIINILSLISLLIFNYKLIEMKILPFKYLLIFVIPIIMVLIFIVLIKFLKNNISLIFINIVQILLVVASIYGYNSINKIDSFFDNMSSKNYELTEYYILTLSNSKYVNINDLKSKSIGVIPKEEETFANVRTNLYELILFDEVSYDDEELGLDALNNSEIEAILISDLNYQILLDEEIIEESKYKIIHTISLKIEIENSKSDKDITKESFNIYISGSDSYGKITTRSRSDVNIVVTVNPNTQEVLITSIPRDYYVQLHGTTGYKDKLTHAGTYGINKSVKTVEDLLDIKIDYYLKVNFSFFVEMVDLLDGIEIYSDTAFSAYTIDNCVYKVGINKVDGWCALGFARERYVYKKGDRHRGENQMQIIEKIIEKVSTNKKYLLKYNEIIKALDDKFSTNADSSDIYAMIKYQLSDMPSWKVTSNSLNGSDAREYTYSYKSRTLYVMKPNENSVNEAKEKINLIINK